MKKFILLIVCAVGIISANSGYSQEGEKDLDLSDLSQEECLYIDSLLIANPDMPIEKRISYYQAVELAHENRGNYFLALTSLDSLISIFSSQNMNDDLAETWREKSLLHDYTGQYSEAMIASQKSLELYKELNNTEEIGYAYNDLGVLNYYIGDQNTARTYFEQALQIFEEQNNDHGIAMYNNNVANTYFEEGDYDKALQLYNKAYEYDLEIENISGQSLTLSNLAETYLEMGNLPKAEELGGQALSIAESDEDPWSLTNTLFVMSRIYYAKQNYFKANVMLERHITVCKDLNAYPELFESYELMCEILTQSNDFQKAYDYHVIWKELQDSIHIVENEKIEDELKIKGLLQENALEIELQKREDEIAQLKSGDDNKNSQSSTVLIILIIALSLAFAGLLFLSFKLKKSRLN